MNYIEKTFVSMLVLLGALTAVCWSLSGCALYNELTTNTAAQVTTLAEAETASTLVAQAADTYVNTAHPSVAQLDQIIKLEAGVNSALTDLETANAQGKSLVFTSFNAALAAFNAYKSTPAN